MTKGYPNALVIDFGTRYIRNLPEEVVNDLTNQMNARAIALKYLSQSRK